MYVFVLQAAAIADAAFFLNVLSTTDVTLKL